jgi:hypothetical protein
VKQPLLTRIFVQDNEVWYLTGVGGMLLQRTSSWDAVPFLYADDTSEVEFRASSRMARTWQGWLEAGPIGVQPEDLIWSLQYKSITG